MKIKLSFKNNLNKKGFVLVEVVIATALISILALALVSVTQKSLQLSDRALKQAQAGYLLEEGAEAVKTIRDNDWSDISGLVIGTNYYLYYDTNTDLWSLSTTTNSIDNIFTRTIVLNSAYRDGNDDLAISGTTDTGVREVAVNVSWSTSSGVVNKNLSFYVTDLFN